MATDITLMGLYWPFIPGCIYSQYLAVNKRGMFFNSCIDLFSIIRALSSPMNGFLKVFEYTRIDAATKMIVGII